MIGYFKTLAAVGLLASLTSSAYAQQPTDVTIKKLLDTMTTSAGQKIVLPGKDAEVIASIFEIPPRASLPEHEHPYPRYGYVLAGNLRVTDTESGQSKTYGPGDFVVESVGRWHTGANAGDEPIKLLVIDIIEAKHSNTVLRNSGQSAK